MKLKSCKKIAAFFITSTIIFSSSSFIALAHSGRTDANGGHWDRKNGTYHYHSGPKANPAPTAAPAKNYSETPQSAAPAVEKTTPEPIPIKFTQNLTKEYVENSTVDLNSFVENKDELQGLTWTLDNPTTGYISDNKLYIAKPGEVSLTATATNGTKNTVKLNVKPMPLQDASFNLPKVINVGDKVDLNISTVPESYDKGKFTFTTSDENIAKVEGKSLVFKKAGKVDITLVSGDFKKITSVQVVEKKIESIKLLIDKPQSNAIEVKVGEKITYHYEATPTTPAKEDVIVTISDSKIAMLNPDGSITANKPGELTIIIKHKDGAQDSKKIKIIEEKTSSAGTVLASAIVLGGGAVYLRKRKKSKAV